MHPVLAFWLTLVLAIPLFWIATSLEKIARELEAANQERRRRP